MDKKAGKRIALFILIAIVIRLGVIFAYNLINASATDYVDLEDHTILADMLEGSSVKTLVFEKNQDDFYTFHIKSSNKDDAAFIFEDGQSEYTIYVNEQIRIQNISELEPGYTDEIAYGVFDIQKEDYKLVGDDYIAKVQLQRSEYSNKSAIFLLGTKSIIRKVLSVRTIYNTLMMVLFITILIVSSFFYYKNKTSYMLITLLISIVSLFKCILSGELLIFNDLFDVFIHNFYFYDSLTNAINYFLYQILLYKLYQIEVKQIYIVAYGGAVLLSTLDYLLFGNIYSFLIWYLLGFLVIISFQIFGCIKEKPYSMIILTTYSVFGGLNLYRILIASNYLQQGYISSIVHGPQIGSIIYILGFLIAVIKTYLIWIEQYEENQKEYARVTLIQGIGHDLKLPLSVIKLNNQMLEKYHMPYREQKEYILNSIEATEELEKMADRINSYLSIDTSIEGNQTTSIRASFEKLEKHYNLLRQDGYKFKVIYPIGDYNLCVEPIQFERMLYNLVDNAFKYNKENGEVSVEYWIKVDEVVIEVADTGIGIRQEFIDKIFDPFYRIETSRTADGIGLGLSVVKGILENLKGSIEVDSKENVGTNIRIAIPKSI